MKAVCNERTYKKNRLSKRIQKTMTVGNSVSTLVMLILLALVISALVGFLGRGFSSYISDKMAEDVSNAYLESMNDREFNEAVRDINLSYDSTHGTYTLLGDVDAESVMALRDVWVETGELDQLDTITMNNKGDQGIVYFDYVISYRNVTIFDSFARRNATTTLEALNRDNYVSDRLFGAETSSIVDENGNEIGSVMVSLSPDIILMTIIISVTLALAVLLINTIINKIISTTTSKIVSKPLETLAEQMELLANEELEDAFNTELVVKRPVSEVTSLMSSTDKIMTKMSEYYQTMMAQNQELEAQKDVLYEHRDELEAQKDELEAQKDELEAQNEELEVSGKSLQSMNSAYLNRTLKLQNLMDNIGQGFMTFGEDLIVNGEFSNVCVPMLCDGKEQDIQGRKISELLTSDKEQREFIETLLARVIKGTKKERELFIPLLPEEINNNGNVQHIDYKIVRDEAFNEQMMIILTDITETRELEEEMSKRHDVLQMIVKVLMNREEFMTLINNFKTFVQSINEPMEAIDFEATLRSIHTYKGSFAQYYMTHISTKLDQLEDAVYGCGHLEEITYEEIESMLNALDVDIKSIESYVGSEFMSRPDYYKISSEKINEVEDELLELLPAYEYNKVLPVIESLRHRSVKDSLSAYPDYVIRLASKDGKSVAPFEIEGEDIFVNFEVYEPVLKSFIHVFRNSMDHGIETMDERVMVKKSETATIKCRVEKEGLNAFAVVIEDDGQGIDINSLKEKALSAGFITEDQSEEMSDEEAIKLIYRQGLTTKDKATTLSGRGVGLAALREMVRSLGGEIKVTSQLGLGTSFRIILPLLQASKRVEVDPKWMMESVDVITRSFLKTIGMESDKGTLMVGHELSLNTISSILDIKGSVDGLVIVSTNKKATSKLVRSFMVETMSDKKLLEYANDVLGEVTNTVMGNVLGVLEQHGVYLNIGVPVMMSNKKSQVRFPNRPIYSLHYDYEGSVMDVHLIITGSNDQTTIIDSE